MKEDSNASPQDQELEKYRLVGRWSFYFLNEINQKIESSRLEGDGEESN